MYKVGFCLNKLNEILRSFKIGKRSTIFHARSIYLNVKSRSVRHIIIFITLKKDTDSP